MHRGNWGKNKRILLQLSDGEIVRLCEVSTSVVGRGPLNSIGERDIVLLSHGFRLVTGDLLLFRD